LIKKQPEEQLQYVLLPIAVSYKKLWATSVGLNEKVIFFITAWSGIKITVKLEYKVWNISSWFQFCASLCPEWQRRIERSTTIFHVGKPCWNRDSNDRSAKLL